MQNCCRCLGHCLLAVQIRFRDTVVDAFFIFALKVTVLGKLPQVDLKVQFMDYVKSCFCDFCVQ